MQNVRQQGVQKPLWVSPKDQTPGTPPCFDLFGRTHDIWWAKGHAWTVSNWAVAGIAGIAGLAHLPRRPDGAPALSPWLVIVTANLLTFVANAYIAQMQADMVIARHRADMIRDRHPELKAILDEVNRGMSTRLTRGTWFMRVLTLVISTAGALATYLTVWDTPLSLVLGSTQMAIAWVLIEYLPCRRLWSTNTGGPPAA